MDGIPEPPRIAFNGISTELPKSPFQKRFANVSDRADDGGSWRALTGIVARIIDGGILNMANRYGRR